MIPYRIAALALIVLAHTGCATLNEAQCVSGDWFSVGEADARAGYTTDRIAQHDKSCAKHGVAVESEPYLAGYRQGLVAFCVPAEAFVLGRRGATYYHQCPPEIERDFIPAYDLGVDLRVVEQDLSRIDGEIARLRDAIDDDKASDATRQAAGQSLDYAKDERRRREYDRSRILDRARERGYGEFW